jgi:hypothetical protein
VSADAAPIFVIGSGRSGTTLFFRMLAEHPALAWISNWSNRFPRSGLALLAARLRHAPGLRALGEHPLRPRPVEGYAPWSACCEGFARPARDLEAADADPDTAARLREMVRRHLAAQGRERFAAKYTGWSRIGFLDRVFPGARYVHVLRDGRAVAASLLRVDFWEGRRGPEHWRWGPLSDEDAALWEAEGRSPLVLAGLQWKLLVRNIRRAGAGAGERYRELRYEELVRDPVRTTCAVARWAGLPEDLRLAERVAAFDVREPVPGWRERLSDEERRRLGRALAPVQAEVGYEG